jgi:hypothetical protein
MVSSPVVPDNLQSNSYSNLSRASGQNQRPSPVTSDSTSCATYHDSTIRASHYRRLSLPDAFRLTKVSSSPTLTVPGSPASGSPPCIAYAAGTSLFRCASSIMKVSPGSSGSVQQGDAPTRLCSPIPHPSTTRPSRDRFEGNRKTKADTIGLGLRSFSLGVGPVAAEYLNKAGSHLELSQVFDLDCPMTDAATKASQRHITTPPIAGLPHASVSGWPSPFHQWNSSQPYAPPALETPAVGSTFSLLSEPSVAPTAPPAHPSTASRWLEIFHDSNLSTLPAQGSQSQTIGLGLGLKTAPSQFPFSTAFAMDALTGTGIGSKPPHPISGLPHSAISQWPISPDLPGWKPASMHDLSSEPASNSTGHRWSACPQSSPLQSSETFNTSCVFSSSSDVSV